MWLRHKNWPGMLYNWHDRYAVLCPGTLSKQTRAIVVWLHQTKLRLNSSWKNYTMSDKTALVHRRDRSQQLNEPDLGGSNVLEVWIPGVHVFLMSQWHSWSLENSLYNSININISIVIFKPFHILVFTSSGKFTAQIKPFKDFSSLFLLPTLLDASSVQKSPSLPLALLQSSFFMLPVSLM